jgi:hypothetical protein
VRVVAIHADDKEGSMTSIAAWAGVDSRGQSSLYISADSRISFPDGTAWDQGRKVFACDMKPHIFGYWGRIAFPALALPLIVDRIDLGFLGCSEDGLHTEVYQAIRRLWFGYPVTETFSIVHCVRTGHGMTSQFSLSVISFRNQKWSIRVLPMPTRSALVLNEGSGKQFVQRAYDTWQNGPSVDTSRAVFSAFCDSLAVGNDPSTGGAPQLAGLYRVGQGRMFGIVHNNQRYFAGAALTGAERTSGVEWRNELFEITNAGRKRRATGAQAHERHQ